MLCVMFSTSPGAWAQGSVTSAGIATSAAPATGTEGYRIAGEAQPTETKAYEYTREMPDGSDGVYWHVKGAATINGGPAKLYPDGSLDAHEHAGLVIQWDLTGTDSLVLQLRRKNPESKEGVEVLADLAISWPFTCTGHIEYYGRTNNPGSSGDRADQFLCPNRPVLPGVVLLDDLFRYETPDCDYFIWTIKYNTASGNVYQEQWRHAQNRTAGRFALYTQVPLRPYSTYPQINPVTGLPSPDWAAHNYTPIPGPVQPQNALAGQNVLSIDVQCTGYRSILCNMSDEQHIYFTGVLGNIGAVTASGTGPYCRDQPVTISTSGSAGATANTRYNWTLLAGTFTGITGNGTSATLNFSSVPPTENTVTVQVQASDNSCGGAGSVSDTQTITLQLAAAAPQPQNMVLSNGLCAGISPKLVSVDGSNSNSTVDYEWRISGLGATFFGGGNTPLLGMRNQVSIVTPNAVPVTVTARRRLATCGGFGPALSTTYQIVSPTPVAPTGAALTWCLGAARTIELVNVQPGLSYFYNAYSIMPAGGVTFTGGANGVGATVQLTPDANGVYPTQFFLVVTVTSPCSSVFSTFGTMLNVPKKPMPCGVTNLRLAAPPILYPNPTTGQVAIAAEPTVAYAWAKVMNAQGQLMQEKKASEDRGVTSLDVSALPTGIYLVQLFDGQHLTTQRLVKE